MAWGTQAITDPARFANLTSHSSDYILGFNEPERADQSNISVAQAISLWPQLMATGKKLVSPAVSDDAAGRAWLTSFMSQIHANNYRVDAIAFHWYGDVRQSNAADSLVGSVNWFRDNLTKPGGQKYPIWITEFAGLDFTNGADPVTQQMNEAFLEDALPALDSMSYVERYAWWRGKPESELGADNPYTPSRLGKLYNGRSYIEGKTLTLAGTEADDTFYLYGGRLRSAVAGRSIRFVDAIEGVSEVAGSANWSVADGWVNVRSGATLQKLENISVSFDGVDVANAGEIAVKAGSLRLTNGTSVTGTGVLKSEIGSGFVGLVFDSAGSGISVENRVELAAGRLSAQAGTHVVSGKLLLSSSNEIAIASTGSLRLTGGIEGSGDLIKTGNGILYLDAASTNTGNVMIAAGTVQVNNATGTAVGTGTLNIDALATLAGDGRVNAVATVDGTLAPEAVNVPGRALRFGKALTLNPSAKVLVDINGTAFDKINSTSTVSLDGQLSLSTVASASDLTPMRIINGASVTGQFGSLAGIAVPGEATRSYAVLYANTGVDLVKTLRGDFNVDGRVNFDDLVILADNLGATGRTWVTGDLNGDGVANLSDLAAVELTYNLSLVGPAGTGDFSVDWDRALGIPEPGTLAGLSLVSMLGLRRRRRASAR
jgi:autotransporter-associated beta strand protein